MLFTINMGPVAATPVKPLLDIAPIRAQVTQATAPNPPLICPMNRSMKSNSLFAMPLPPINVPATTKRGLASKTKLHICGRVQTMRLFIPVAVAADM